MGNSLSRGPLPDLCIRGTPFRHRPTETRPMARHKDVHADRGPVQHPALQPQYAFSTLRRNTFRVISKISSSGYVVIGIRAVVTVDSTRCQQAASRLGSDRTTRFRPLPRSSNTRRTLHSHRFRRKYSFPVTANPSKPLYIRRLHADDIPLGSRLSALPACTENLPVKKIVKAKGLRTFSFTIRSIHKIATFSYDDSCANVFYVYA